MATAKKKNVSRDLSRKAANRTARPKPKPDENQAMPRIPRRGRGLIRFQTLLDATEQLLMTDDPDEIGLYQIAERAGIPAASIYHFFPTKEAAFLALSQSFLDKMEQRLAEPIPASEILGWPELTAIDMRKAMTFYNSHIPMLKISYGGFPGVSARAIDELFSQKLAANAYARFDRLFHMPVMGDVEIKFGIRLAIIDSIWTASFRQHGEITEVYLQEAHNASVAYLSQFLPRRLELRPFLVAAAANNKRISLPFSPLVDEPARSPKGRVAPQTHLTKQSTKVR